MIVFKDWTISVFREVIARQYDNLTRRLEVIGDLPEGWDWALLVQVHDSMDIIPLEPMEGGAGVTLNRDQLAYGDVHYNLQLRGTQGELTRHTNIISTYIPRSISGDGQWPEVPSEFTEMEQRILAAGQAAEQAAQEAVDAIGRAAWIGFELDEDGQLLAVLSPGADADFALTEDGYLEVIHNG